MGWTQFLRQLLISSGPWTLYFIDGLCIGLPTVLVPQLRRVNQTISDEAASWLSSMHTYSSIPWLFILSGITVEFGRKKAHLTVCISSFIGFIIFFFSSNITHILIGQIFQGALSASSLTTCIVVLTEFMSSKYRGAFLALKSATLFWGILVANSIGTFLHWQNIPILGIACGIYSLINVTVWPESPLWLVSRGRYEECSAAHRWLKGVDEESEKELEKLLKCHERRIFTKPQWRVRFVFKIITRKEFMKPILLSTVLTCLYSFSGKLVCTIYAIDILKKITNSESTAYKGMLILDGVTVFSMYLGCFISKMLKRRVMIIGFSIAGIAFMVIISGYLYFSKLSIISENKYVSIFLLAGYSISVSCGPMIMSTSIIGELWPLKSRILSMCITAIIFKFTFATFTKISPFCFRALAMHGTFTLYAILSFIFLCLIYLYLPETKDRTIEEIDYFLRGEDKIIVEEGAELININSRKN